MGLTQSKTPQPVVQQKALDLSPQFTAPEGIVEKIKGLGDVITFFNDNDTTSIENFIDTYNKQVSAKEQIDIGPEIKGLMLGFHNQLLEVIDGQLVGATPSEKQQVLKSKLKDNKQLNDMLRLYYNQRMQDVETRVLNDEVVKSNPEITETVRLIMNNVKSLKVKYKFFEYKYIQLNVFMIVFIQYVYNSMGKFIVDVIAYNQARDAIRQEMTQKIFKATQEIVGASDMQLKAQDAEAINKMIANLQDKVQRDQKEIQELSGKLKNNSLSDLLNFVLTSDETLASHIMEGVDKYKADKTVVQQKPVQPVVSAKPQQPVYQKPVQIQVTTPAQMAQTQAPAQAPVQTPAPTPAPTPTPAPQPIQPPTQPPQVPKPNVATPTNVKPVQNDPTNPPYQKKPYLGKKPLPTYMKPPAPGNAPKAPNASKTPPLSGGFWRDSSLIPQQQSGGFIRDNSLIPQSFYELNRS